METASLTYLPSVLRYLPKKLIMPEKFRELLLKYYPTVFSPPCMTAKEYHLFRKYTKAGHRVVEFGAGGSTFMLLEQGKTLFSVESDKGFIDYLQTVPLIREKINQQKLCLYHADLGETIKWGKPKDKAKEANWPCYYQAVWENVGYREPDVVFVDGRFRVMCALNSIPYIRKDTVVIMHDFFRRKHLSAVLEFFEVIDTVDFLVVLRMKNQIDSERLEEVMLERRLDYR